MKDENIEWDGSKFVMSDMMVTKLERIYSKCNVRKELQKMELWYIANPKKQKKRHLRFIMNWLDRAETRGDFKNLFGSIGRRV